VVESSVNGRKCWLGGGRKSGSLLGRKEGKKLEGLDYGKLRREKGCRTGPIEGTYPRGVASRN